MRHFIIGLLLIVVSSGATAQENSFAYAEIAKRHKTEQLSAKQVEEARMHGECLVGLKELNFRSSDQFDPVAEWTNYRSISLLEQFPPCYVLVMMEIARAEMFRLIGEEE